MNAKNLAGLLFGNCLDGAAAGIIKAALPLPANGNFPVYRSGLYHVERNVDIAPCCVGICTCLAMSSVHNGLSDFALQAR
jgi:hypothetical protein